MGEAGQGQWDALLLSGVKREANVLVHPLCGKVGGEVPFEHERSLIGDEAGLGRAIIKDLQHQLGVDSGLGAQHDTLVKRLHDVGKNQVLSELGLQATPWSAAIVELLAHDFKEWL